MKPTKANLKKAAEAARKLTKESNAAVLAAAKVMRSETDARIRRARLAEILDGFKGSVAVEIFQRAEIRNARIGAVQSVLVHI